MFSRGEMNIVHIPRRNVLDSISPRHKVNLSVDSDYGAVILTSMKQVNELTKEEHEKHIQMFGGYNDPLPNMQVITSEEFAQSKFFIYSPIMFEFRHISPQLCKSEEDRKKLFGTDKAVRGTYIFYVDGPGVDGIAMISDFWGKKVQYYTFSRCVHEYRPMTKEERDLKNVSLGRCEHASICPKCGQWNIIDSSD